MNADKRGWISFCFFLAGVDSEEVKGVDLEVGKVFVLLLVSWTLLEL